MPVEEASSMASSSAHAGPHSHAAVSLETLLFLYQVLVALAISNGMFVFFTDGSGTYVLRPWSSFNLLECGLFLIFIATLTLFAHTNTVLIHKNYMHGFHGAKLRPIVDYWPLFIQAGIFYVLSHTFAQAQQRNDPLAFYKIMAVLFAFDILWAFASFCLKPAKQRTKSDRNILYYGALNTVATAAGIGLYILSVRYQTPLLVNYLQYFLLGILTVRLLIDYSITYDFLFPGAMQREMVREPALVGADRTRSAR